MHVTITRKTHMGHFRDGKRKWLLCMQNGRCESRAVQEMIMPYKSMNAMKHAVRPVSRLQMNEPW